MNGQADTAAGGTRVLLVTRNFPPLTGGMERLMQQVASGIGKYAHLTIIGPRGCSDYAASGTRVFEAPAGLVGFLWICLWHICRECRRDSFDVAIGGSGLVAPLLRLAGYLSGAKTVIFLHGLDLVVRSAIYQTLFTPSIRKINRVIANSANTRELALQRGVPVDRISVINPGTTVPENITQADAREFRRRHGLETARIMLFVGRMTQRKGLSRFIESSLMDVLRAEPRARLVVVGDNPDQGLTRMGEQAKVMDTVKNLGLEQQVIFLGRVGDSELAGCYAAADVHIFPLVEVEGDVEGFGMVAVEAAAHGTPTVAFSLGGVADAVSPDSGYLVEAGRYDLFSNAVLKTLHTGEPDPARCMAHARNFRWEAYEEKLRNVLESMV